jgi:hypothetical protein
MGGSDNEVVISDDEGSVPDDRSVYSVDREAVGDDDDVQDEVLEAEELAVAARRRASRERKPDTPRGTDSDGSQGGRPRKRRRAEGAGSEDEEDDPLVPFVVNGFCQGCQCKQQVYIVGPVKKRRREEVDLILLALQTRYGVSLAREVTGTEVKVSDGSRSRGQSESEKHISGSMPIGNGRWALFCIALLHGVYVDRGLQYI